MANPRTTIGGWGAFWAPVASAEPIGAPPTPVRGASPSAQGRRWGRRTARTWRLFVGRAHPACVQDLLRGGRGASGSSPPASPSGASAHGRQKARLRGAPRYGRRARGRRLFPPAYPETDDRAHAQARNCGLAAVTGAGPMAPLRPDAHRGKPSSGACCRHMACLRGGARYSLRARGLWLLSARFRDIHAPAQASWRARAPLAGDTAELVGARGRWLLSALARIAVNPVRALAAAEWPACAAGPGIR